MLVWVVVTPFAVWAVLRPVPADVHFRWVQLVAFTPYAALASAVAPLVALASRRWTALAVSLAATASLAAWVLPRALPAGETAADGPPLRVLSSNLLMGSVPATALVDLVRKLQPDVLTVQELTPGAASALEKAGLARLLPYKTERPRPGVGGSAIYARHPVTPGQAIEVGGFGQAAATVDVPGAGPVGVVSVHPCAPSRADRFRCWADGLAALPPPGRTPRILAGDFNATLDHTAVRELLGEGYADAADATGDGFVTTWPYRPWHFNGFGIPPVTIDHVLAGPGVGVRTFAVHTLPATDHRAVFAELVLPRAA
ncbi:endonuclease/exonuclease/phosphatase family protein [Sphaerisporangium album]|uniref:Endonuclease/exonuclease/phosphatase family protein n=1 Tax=Sphaerisporangium album TaxID=509200 RepID=A0A367FST5_9ACTN|nr:endonuclease/exonuclease/phosphatase family protein [Sphaerisporangium album]